MDASTFSKFLVRIADLTRSQCAHVLELLKPIVDQGKVAAVIEQAVAGKLHCGRGPVTAGQLTQHLQPVLASDVLLVTDGNKAYQTFARQTGTSHEYVNLQAGVRVRGAIHMQNVDAYHSRLHTWLRHFNGVATRYMSNYLGWRWAIDQQRIHSPETLLRAAIGVFHT